MKSRIKKSASRSAHRGLTLIELLIVMVILAALAGILVPLLNGYITKAHGTSAATNISELAKAIQTYQANYLGAYPNNFDSLLTSAGAFPLAIGGTGSYFPAAASSDLQIGTLTTGQLAALNNAGITTVANLIDAPAAASIATWSPTFMPYANAVLTTPPSATLGTTAVTLTQAAQLREFGLTANVVCVVFGVGSYTSMQGQAILEAPVHFEDDPTATPALVYARFGVVFQVADANGVALPTAKLVGCCDFSTTGINNMNDHLNDYWTSSK